MDKTALTSELAHLFSIAGYKVDTSVRINHAEIDIRAEETQGLLRKVILVECADYGVPVGVQKMRTDVAKLKAAEKQSPGATSMHVSRHGYTPDASGYASTEGIPYFTLEALTYQLVNFSSYIESVEHDAARPVILREYQQTKLHYDTQSTRKAKPALDFITEWISGSSRWLTILGDYGVGKSWMLKRFLYHAIEQHQASPDAFPLPLFVPLQRFTKAFDYENLILRVFQLHGLAGVPYAAFDHLAQSGRVLFLFDSFDEMAQHLHRDTIRENLKELLVGMSGKSKAIMTSRPTYFEGRLERLVAVEADGLLAWHPLDQRSTQRKAALSSYLTQSLEASQFARLTDLTATQRRLLFARVLGKGSKAYSALIALLRRFNELGSISQRAVIARLLTTVAETVASGEQAKTIEGYPLLPDDLKVVNQAKIFEIVTHNLLYRDEQIGTLSSSERYVFLKSLAVYLQRAGQWPFAGPDEIRNLVERVFRPYLRRSDSPEQLLEQYYRICRRHSGLTTENQFQDTTGRLDTPIEEFDITARVGFSHNSLREYLVADAFADYVMGNHNYRGLEDVVVTDATATFFCDSAVYNATLGASLANAYRTSTDSRLREKLFRLLFAFALRDPRNLHHLGDPPALNDLDLTGLDCSGIPLRRADFSGSLLPDTDLRGSDLRNARFAKAVIDGVLFDGASLEGADFTEAEVDGIFVYDEYDTKTTSVLEGKAARQWLFSHGARVENSSELNSLLGKPWYQAAREVTRTLEGRIAGTHQSTSLAKGTRLEERPFAQDFVKYLRRSGVLENVKKSGKGSMIVRVKSEHRETISRFSHDGVVHPVLQAFFEKFNKA